MQRFVLVNQGPLPVAPLAPRPRQVLAQLLEIEPPLQLDIRQYPTRPTQFQLPALGRMEGFDGKRWAEIVFREHGRGFIVFVGVGVEATSEEPRLLASINSLVVEPR